MIKVRAGKLLLASLLFSSGCVHVDVTGYIVNLAKQTVRVEPSKPTPENPIHDESIAPPNPNILDDPAFDCLDSPSKARIIAALKAALGILDKKTCLSADDIATIQRALNNCN